MKLPSLGEQPLRMNLRKQRVDAKFDSCYDKHIRQSNQV
ncbi:hypothetical protein LAC1533_2244 [Ligilactobacillus acidipiscis]|uniref:Uncharacterized protein n=1 Tax=Ligilactobacillus acidipiscis TaxID=89059 RepID=A0A1K1KS31_9LACO|nr:hypothetical protein LAC1533_2244 [Ligilactobacillus acidipiscis]